MRRGVELMLFVALGLFIAGSTGCSTTRSVERDEIDRLRARVLQLESEVEIRDKKQREAEDELERAYEARQAIEDKLDAQRREFAEAEKERFEPEPQVEPAKPKDEGMSNVAARQIQTALYNAGYDPGPIDGKLGKKTKLAIKEFQRDNGLSPDGVVGNKTWSKLGKYLTMKRYEK